MAATLKMYEVPFVNPVTVVEVDVDTPSLKVVHVELFVEYCTTQSVIDAAVAALAVHDKGTCVFPTVPTVSVGAPGATPGTTEMTDE